MQTFCSLVWQDKRKFKFKEGQYVILSIASSYFLTRMGLFVELLNPVAYGFGEDELDMVETCYAENVTTTMRIVDGDASDRK